MLKHRCWVGFLTRDRHTSDSFDRYPKTSLAVRPVGEMLDLMNSMGMDLNSMGMDQSPGWAFRALHGMLHKVK